MSPMFFGIAIDWIMRKCTQDDQLGIKWLNNSRLFDLDFADDVAILNSTTQATHKLTSNLCTLAEQVGLQINSAKTKIMDLTNSTDNIVINGQTLEVEHFTYLGSKVSNNGDTMKEINSRIAIAASAFTKLTNIWQSQDLSICTKVKLFRSCVIPVLTYGCESWKSTKKIDKKLDSFENKCLRKLLKVKWSDFVSNNTVRDRTHQQPVSNIIRKRRWKYLGHVLRSDEKRLNRQVLMWSPVGKRKRGRPKTTLRRTIQQESKLLGCKTIQDLQLLAKNRITWRSKTSALCAAFGTKGTN